MSLTNAVSKQKAFILMAGFHSLTDKPVLRVCVLLCREEFYEMWTTVCLRQEGVNGLKTV
jgi:hypothetical protein